GSSCLSSFPNFTGHRSPCPILLRLPLYRGRDTVVIAGDSFVVDNAGARAQPVERINDQWKAAGWVIAEPAVEPLPLTILAGDDSESIVLDLMQPLAAGGQLIGFGWKARRDEAGRKSTRTGEHDLG